MLTTDQIRTMLDAATPGPWETLQRRTTYGHVHDVIGPVEPEEDGSRIDFIPVVCADSLDTDARLIAAAPELAAEVLRLRKGIKALADHVEANSCAGIIPRLRALLDGGDQ